MGEQRVLIDDIWPHGALIGGQRLKSARIDIPGRISREKLAAQF
jgi:hypothetical protein